MKKLLSLALALALCLSLAVPALAAEPTVVEEGWIYITNVVEQGVEDGYWIDSFVCIAPVEISASAEFLATQAEFPDHSFWLSVEKVTDGEIEYIPTENQSVTLTEEGTYNVTFEESWGDGGGFTPYRVIVQADGEIAPTVPTTDPTTTNPGAKPGFTDVNEGDWFYDAVAWAVEKEITNGTSETTFSPGQDCTEAQILTFLWRANGCPEPENAVDSDAYYAKAAKWAVEQGIVDEFEADVPCTRAMTVDFLWRAAGKPESDTEIAFTDVTAGTDLESAVAWAVEKEITNGTSETTFDPDAVCTRGHIVTFLYRNLAE